MSYLIYLNIVIGLFLAYILFWNCHRLIVNFIDKKRLVSSLPISRNVKKGDYVNFTGKLSTPPSKAPISKADCGYWRLVVKGVFQRKRKKPNKGMQTFKPIAYIGGSDNLPFLISNEKMSVQYVFRSHQNLIVNPDAQTKKTSAPPWFSGVEKVDKSTWKSKFSCYESLILTIPCKAVVTCFGEVIAVTKNSVILSESKKSEHITKVFIGGKETFFNKLNRLIVCQLLLLIFFILSFYSLLKLASDQFGTIEMSGLLMSLFLIGYGVKRYTKKLFSR